MDNLLDVGSCLRALQSTKITERKKAAAKLEDLLKASSVVETLHKNSENSRGIGWNVVLNTVKTYVDLEIEALQKAKDSQSAVTLANRGKRKQEILSLFKIIIRKSNEKKPYLQLSDLLESILDWLKDDFKLKAFGVSLTNLLLKNVFQVRKYWLEISADDWKKFLLLHCQLFLNNEFDRSLLSRAIYKLIVGSTRQGTIQPHKIMLFFEKALDIIKRDAQATTYILSALNVFHWSVASNCRLQLCEFGEKNMTSLLSIWSKPGNEKIKEDLVDLLYLQMVVHHPHGMALEQDGALAHDWELWKRQLKSLQDSIVTDIDNAIKRTYFQAGSRGLSFLTPGYINLAAHVFKQIPSCILTQANGQRVEDELLNATPAKRQRISSENRTLLDFIMENSNKTQAIPWLKILNAILMKFPTSLGMEDLLMILQQISSLLKECTKAQLFEHLFKVLSALAKAFQHDPKPSLEHTKNMWLSIWTTCLNTVVSRQAQTEGYQTHGVLLMTTILNGQLVRPTRDVWNVFLLNLCKPTRASCTLLASIIVNKGLDERYSPSILGRTGDASGNCRFPLRHSLLKWLLSDTCVDEFRIPDMSSSSSPDIVSLLCSSLLHQDPVVVLQDMSAQDVLMASGDEDCVANSLAPSREIKSRDRFDLPTPLSLQSSGLDLFYLNSTFNMADPTQGEKPLTRSMEKVLCSSVKRKSCNPLVSDVVKSLVTLLEMAVSSFTELTDANVHSVQHLVWFSSFTLKLCMRLNSYNDRCSQVHAVLTESFEKLGSLFMTFVHSNNTAGLQPVLNNLVNMLDFQCWSENGQKTWVAEFLKNCLGSGFFNVIFDLASGKKLSVQDSNSRRQNRYGSRASSRLLSERDFMDNSSENESLARGLGGHEDMETDDFDVDEATDSNLGDSSRSSSTVSVSYDASDFLSPLSLKESDQVRLACIKFLCLFASLDTSSTPRAKLLGSGTDKSDTQRQLLQLISNDHFRPEKSVDMLVLLTVSFHLLHGQSAIDMCDVKEILIALRHTAKEHFKDQEICCRLLFHLRQVIPLLSHEGVDDVSDILVSCRNIMVKFVKHFGVIYTESAGPVKIEYIRVLLELLKHDPDGTWAQLGTGQGDDSSDDDDDTSTMSQLFLSHLKDDDMAVKMLVASELNRLVTRWSPNGASEPLRKGSQLAMLRNIIQTFQKVLDKEVSQRGRTHTQLEEEARNRRAVCLQGVATVLTHSPVCEKECLLWLCQFVAEREIPPSHVIKMLTVVCAGAKFLNVKAYLECHLPFLVLKWFERLKESLQNFPFQLMGYNSLKEFTRSHQEIVVSRLFMASSNMDDLQNLTGVLDADVHQLLLLSLPHILTFVLPVYVRYSPLSDQLNDTGQTELRKHFKKVSKCYNLLKSELLQQEISDCVCQRLCEITVLVISCLQVQKGNTVFLTPDPNPPFFTQAEVVDTLDYIANTLSGHNSKPDETISLVSLLAKIPCGLHSVLTSLYSAMSREHLPHERLRQAQMYRLFVGMVMKEFHTGLEDSWAAVMREIMCRLMILLSNSSTTPTKDCGHDIQQGTTLTFLEILDLVCVACIETCPDEMAKYLLRVMDVVSNLAHEGGPISQQAIHLMTNVVRKAKEQWEQFEHVLLQLSPLPDVPCLEDLNANLVTFADGDNKSLKERLASLSDSLALLGEHPSRDLALRLKSLAVHVVQHRDQLDTLLLTPQGSECVKGAISQLLHLTSCPSPSVAMAAAKLLGAIGPVGLTSLSLPRMQLETPDFLAMTTYKEHEFEKYCWLLHFLDTCLLDKRSDVVTVAGCILKSILVTQPILEFKDSYQRKLKDQSFLFNYLHPFHQGQQKKSMAPPPALRSVQSITIRRLDLSDLWTPCSADVTHDKWITNLVDCILISGAIIDEALRQIMPMCSLKVEINEEVLPYLIHTILQGDDSGQWRVCLSKHFRAFFQAHCSQIGRKDQESCPVYLKKQSIRVMLNVVLHLRKQSKKSRARQPAPTLWDNNFWLDLDYLHIARAAYFCQANFSALLFIEIWWNVARQNSASNSSDSGSQDSTFDPLSVINSANSHFRQDVQALLLDIYSSVGDPDAFYGCGAGRKSDAHSRVLTYLHESKQAKALTTLDIEISHSRSMHNPLRLLQTIQACGADNLLLKCFEGFDQNWSDSASNAGSKNSELEEFRYETAWKLGQWDFGVPSSYNETSSLPFHKAVYNTLYSMRENHLDVATCVIKAARKACLVNFDLKAETCQGLYVFLSQLQSLGILQEVVCSLQNGDQNWKEVISNSIEGTLDDRLCFNKASNFDCLLSQLELISSLTNVIGADSADDSVQLRLKALSGLAVCARQAKQFQLAEKTMHTLKMEVMNVDAQMVPDVSEQHVRLEEAKLFWGRSEVKIAMDVLKNLISDMNETQGQGTWPLLPKALATYGIWLAETRSETPSVIMSNYLEKSVDLLEDPCVEDKHQAVECFLALAQYADAKYQQISDYMKSPVYKDKMALLQGVKDLLSVAEDMKASSKYLMTIEKSASIDEEEIKSLNRDHPQILKQALLNYLRVLKHGSDHDLKVFRLVALWFENGEDDEVNQMIQLESRDIANFKFLPLYYQLAARMNTDGQDSNFQTVLQQLMERVAREHPHHTLWTIMALSHAKKDNEVTNKVALGRRGSRASTSQDQVTEEGRLQAARQMLDRMKEKSDRPLGGMIRKMETLSTAYIELANWNVSEFKNERKPFAIDSKLQITKLRDLSGILLPTVDLKVEPSGDYPQVVFPSRFSPTVRLVGGVNLPKVFSCTGSDGKERLQLVKGRDDLRQDAVMQQVFSLVNQVLAAEPETRKRNLSIRTYKVVPLSQKSGLLEWCKGTQPLGEYLIGSRFSEGAHTRYRPKDWKALECRAHLHKSLPERRFKAYQEICAHFQPVLKHFFMEKFKDPPQWFERRLAYTRSVATNSIVGYIMGLGDRHLQNILIDIHTAELVHIDLGIAFEMGHILPTPETVPFRLTRDIVDGMGITGVEGVFRRCCKKTMQVLRHNAECLMTIVQVLIYDPLSHWSLSPHQVLAIQKKRERMAIDSCEASSMMLSGTVPSSGQFRNSALPTTSGTESVTRPDDKNKMAERTLLRLKEKLSGMEDGGQLGVDGQVNSLIQQASDPKNLSLLYAGWQPYL